MPLITFSIPVPAVLNTTGVAVDISSITNPFKTFIMNAAQTDAVLLQVSPTGAEPWGNLSTLNGDDKVSSLSADIGWIRAVRTKGTGATVDLAVAGIDAASISGTVTADQGAPGALPWPVTAELGGALDVPLSTLATEATVATLATEATVATLATEATVATLATEATVATLATEATLATRVADATITARLNTLGQKIADDSAPVVLASDQPAIPISGVVDQGVAGSDPWPVSLPDADSTNLEIMANAATNPATATVTTVNASDVSVTLFVADGTRRGGTIFNDSPQSLWIKFGASASLTDYTRIIPSLEGYDLPEPVYTGRIDGIWTQSNGHARVTKVTS